MAGGGNGRWNKRINFSFLKAQTLNCVLCYAPHTPVSEDDKYYRPPQVRPYAMIKSYFQLLTNDRYFPLIIQERGSFLSRCHYFYTKCHK